MNRKRKLSEAEVADVAQEVRNAYKGDPEALLAALSVPDELDDEDLIRQERAIRKVRRKRSYARRLEDGFAMLNGEYPESEE